jgi:hypothetical protein
MLVHVAKHRQLKERTALSRLFGRHGEQDNLFERSFRTCEGCGEDVYVLAEDCRECGTEVALVAV